MNKILAVCFTTAIVGTLMVGCDLLPTGITESNPPTIKKLTMQDTLLPGESYPVTGEVRADEEITGYRYEILTNSGNIATGITVEGPNIKGDDKYTFTAQELKVIVGDNAAAGTYRLRITVTAGENGSGERSFYVKGKTVVEDPDPEGTPVTTATIKAGANGNNDYGSSIDLDAGIAYKMKDAGNHESEIDLCYAYSGQNSVEKIGTAYWAQESKYDFAMTWLKPTNVKFYKITMSASEFAAITTKEQIPDFDDSKARTSFECKAGDVFIVKTTAGAIALIRISSQTAGSTGYIEIKMAK
ncbi:MAG: hypothetical protein GX640_19130 [Fibrobacter sp.]|nr:hypothetical protein [Fibrobacter sp.]